MKAARDPATAWRHVLRGALASAISLPTLAGSAAFAQDAALRRLVAERASEHGVPANFGHAVVTLESGYRPRIVHAGNYGLMQVRLSTARSMGFRGTPAQLVEPDTNLRLGMRYLGRAWKLSNADHCRAIALYRTGFASSRVDGHSRTYCARARVIMARQGGK
jgi:soluble lytic murein transglycosylase-like protein